MFTRKLWIVGLGALLLVGTAVAASGTLGADLMHKGRGRGAHGSFEIDGDAVTGRYVSFTQADAGVADYARIVNGSAYTIFESISLETLGDNVTTKARGPVYSAADGEGNRLMAFDARNAAFFLKTVEGNVVTLVVADGIALTAFEEQEKWSPAGVLLETENAKGRLELRGNGTVSVVNQTITVTLEEGAHLSFRIVGHPKEWAAEHGAMQKMAKHPRGPRHGPREAAPEE